MDKKDGWLGGLRDKEWVWTGLAILILGGAVVSLIIAAFVNGDESQRAADWSDYALEEKRGADFEPYDGR